MQRAMNVAGRMGALERDALEDGRLRLARLSSFVVFAFGNIALGLKQIDHQRRRRRPVAHRPTRSSRRPSPNERRRPSSCSSRARPGRSTTRRSASTVDDVIALGRSSSPAIKNLNSPYDPRQRRPDQRRPPLGDGQVGDEGRRRPRRATRSTHVSAATDKVGTQHPDFYVGHAGVSSDKALDKMFSDQLAAGRRALDPDHDRRPAARARTLVAVGSRSCSRSRA